MQPRGNQNSNISRNNNRNLLRRLEQERRRREVEEKYISREKTPVLAKPYRTNKEDELSRHIKHVLGEWDLNLIPWQESPPSPLWFPQKSKSMSQTCRSGLASRKTNPYENMGKEFSLQSLGLKPNTEQNSKDCNEVVSKQRSEAKAPPSKILPEPVKEKKPIGVPCTEKTWKSSPAPAEEGGTSTAQQLGVRELQGLPQLASLCTSRSTSTQVHPARLCAVH
ncbi:uncharacterized protein M8220_017295 [Acridotheres tristis]